MEITAAILFHLLSQRLPLRYDRDGAPDFSITPANPYRAEILPGRFYILPVGAALPDPARHADSAFLLLCPPPETGPLAPNVAYVLPPADLSGVYDRVDEALGRLRLWDQRMWDAVTAACDLERIFALVREVLDLSFAVVDRNLENVAHCPDYFSKFRYFKTEPGRVTDKAAQELMLDAEFLHNIDREGVYFFPEEPSGDQFLCRNFFVDGQNLARFHAILEPRGVSAGEQALFAHVSDYVRRVFLLHYAGERASRHQRDGLHRLMRGLIFLREPVSAEEISRTLDIYNWRGGDRYFAVALRFIDDIDSDIRARHLCQTLGKLFRDACALTHERSVLCIINAGRGKEAGTIHDVTGALVYTLRDMACRAGISDSFEEPTEVGVYCRQAGAALRIGQRKNPHAWYFLFNDCIVDHILIEASRDCSRRQLVHKGLLRLMDHDAQKGTDFVRSLRLYLESRFNASEAAQAVFVHRATFIRRLERIEEISGLDLQSMKELTHLFMSFYLLDEMAGL